MTGAHYDDVIVGAGLTGLVTALLLARAGRQVAVLEARSVGAVTTGHSTAKVTLLQGTRLSTIVANHTEHVASAYLDGNREAQEWLLTYCEEQSVGIERRDAYTYAGTQSGASAVRREFDIGRRLDLPVEMTDAVELPYATYAAVCLRDQLQFNPVAVLTALVRELREAGGVVIDGIRVHKVDPGESSEVITSAGRLRRGHRRRGPERLVPYAGSPSLSRRSTARPVHCLRFVPILVELSASTILRSPGTVRCTARGSRPTALCSKAPPPATSSHANHALADLWERR